MLVTCPPTAPRPLRSSPANPACATRRSGQHPDEEQALRIILSTEALPISRATNFRRPADSRMEQRFKVDQYGAFPGGNEVFEMKIRRLHCVKKG